MLTAFIRGLIVTCMAKRRVEALEETAVRVLLGQVSRHRYAERDRAGLLLNIDAGLTAQEIARVTWRMVLRLNAQENDLEVDDVLLLEPGVRRGTGLRRIEMTRRLRDSLVVLWSWYRRRRRTVGVNDPILLSERASKDGNGVWIPMKANSISRFFLRLSERSGIYDCTTLAGRRAFAQRLLDEESRRDPEAVKRVSELTGHKNVGDFERLLK